MQADHLSLENHSIIVRSHVQREGLVFVREGLVNLIIIYFITKMSAPFSLWQGADELIRITANITVYD